MFGLAITSPVSNRSRRRQGAHHRHVLAGHRPASASALSRHTAIGTLSSNRICRSKDFDRDQDLFAPGRELGRGLVKGDRVTFSVHQSERKPGRIEARRVQRAA